MGRLFGWILRTLFWGVLGVALLVAGWSAWIAWRINSSLPQIEGEIAVAGITGEVSILRDEHGVPHIFGETDADVFFGLGFVHAQDRLFQMELMRRAVQGRLSEVVGSAALPVDRRSRTLGFARSAAGSAALMDDETRAVVEAYAAGVNALIDSNGFVAPPEFQLLMFSPEPWSVEDTAGVLYYMADSLVAGAGDEFARARLASALEQSRIDEFLTPYPDFGVTALSAVDMGLVAPAEPETVPADIAEDAEALEDAADADDAAEPGVEEEPGPGSNNWVVSGDLTASGAPLLANDPHLNLSAPGIWYLARLALSDGDVVGMTLAGAPMVVLGRNEHAAWAFTNTGYDVQDLALIPLEELDSERREERINVRLGGAQTHVVLETELGPVLDREQFGLDMFPEDVAVVLHTTADDFDNMGIRSALALMRARDWDDFVEAGRGWTAPMQNVLFASVDGTIGYASPGRMPQRDDDGAWIGEVAYEALPRVRDPQSGSIVTANNRIAPEEYPYPTPGAFAVYRALRIEDLIDDTELHDIASFAHMQADVVSVHAQRLLPALRRARPQTELGRIALSLLQEWNGEMDAERGEPLIFETWLRFVHPAVYEDELGEAFGRYDYSRRVFLDHVFNGRLSHWCDNVETPERETCAEISGDAMDAAAVYLLETYGPDPMQWRWGDAHQAAFDHPIPFFNTLPVLRDMFGERQPVGGDGSTVNVAHFSFNRMFDVNHAASMRAIYDLSDLDASVFMHAPGQSGHPLSPHYRDLAPLWAAGEYFEVRTDWPRTAPPPATRVLTLRPRD